jgi:hypothetical protein
VVFILVLAKGVGVLYKVLSVFCETLPLSLRLVHALLELCSEVFSKFSALFTADSLLIASLRSLDLSLIAESLVEVESLV